MGAGKYRHRITIYSPPSSQSDGLGGFMAAGDEGSITVWAEVTMLPAKESLIDGKILYKQPYRIKLRYIKSIAITSSPAYVAPGYVEPGYDGASIGSAYSSVYALAYSGGEPLTVSFNNHCRIEWQGRKISINSVVEDARQTELTLSGVLVN